MNTRRAYWACQALGWSGYSAAGIVIAAQNGAWRASTVAGYLLFAVYSIALTDLLRREIRRRRWLNAKAWWVLPRLTLAITVVGAVQAILVTSIDVAFLRARSPFLMLSTVLYLWWGVTFADGIWVLLYVQLTAKRRHSEKEAQLQLGLREAELRALESQINPHFLFTCLNSIRALVVEDPPKAQEMLTRLANMLRYNLHRDLNHTVPLASEVGAVGDYLALEAVRFQERLRVRFAIDPQAAEMPVPPLLLQTLVENAIKHGVAPRPSGGELVITAVKQSNGILVEVENTGRLAQASTAAPQLGLANIRERLRWLYGDSARLELANRDGDKVAATVLIPVLS